MTNLTGLHEAAMRQAEYSRFRLSQLRLAYKRQGIQQLIKEQALEARKKHEQHTHSYNSTDPTSAETGIRSPGDHAGRRSPDT